MKKTTSFKRSISSSFKSSAFVIFTFAILTWMFSTLMSVVIAEKKNTLKEEQRTPAEIKTQNAADGMPEYPQTLRCSASLSLDHSEQFNATPKAEIIAHFTGIETPADKETEGQSLVHGTIELSYQLPSGEFKNLGSFAFKALLAGDERGIHKVLLISNNTFESSRIFHGVLDLDAESTSSLSVMVEDKLMDFATNCEENPIRLSRL